MQSVITTTGAAGETISSHGALGSGCHSGKSCLSGEGASRAICPRDEKRLSRQ